MRFTYRQVDKQKSLKREKLVHIMPVKHKDHEADVFSAVFYKKRLRGWKRKQFQEAVNEQDDLGVSVLQEVFSWRAQF